MRNSKPKSVSARIHLGNLPFATLSPPSMSVPTCSDHHTSLTRSSCQLDANSDSKFDVSWSSDAATSQLGQTGFDRDDPLESVLFRVSPVHLPHRCHYTPTVEYLHGPPHTLHTMPSMIQSWIFGCSEGPSRMFRRSKSDVPKVQDVPKVPVGCSEGPSWMFGRSESDVWKVLGCLEVPDVWKFQSDVRRLLGDGIVTSHIYTYIMSNVCQSQCDVECVLRELGPLLWLARAT